MGTLTRSPPAATAALVTDRRPSSVSARGARRFGLEELGLLPAAIECSVPDLAVVERRLREGSFDFTWVDVEPEAVLAVARLATETGRPVLVSSPGGPDEAALDELASLAASADVRIGVAGELTGAPGIEQLRSLLPATPSEPPRV